ncbi:MAG: hypothetical protein NTX44_03860 [Ignavibacteriales bacterium]|nr:hypothetical protein [Ignavibacteriales bacterium]
MNKKQIILAAMMLVAATNFSFTQSFFPTLGKLSPVQIERIDKNYAAALASGNNGIVESALAIITMIKLDQPAIELPLLRTKIEYLASYSRTPSIRYKACLANGVLADPAMFKQVSARQYNDPDEFFSAIDGKSDQTSLSLK